MKVQYHGASQQDVPGMLALFKQLRKDQHEVSFADITEIEEIAEWMEAQGNYLYVARCNQQVIGVLRAVREEGRYQQHACHITIAVSSDYRQQGVAKSLVLFALSDLKSVGLKMARALVFSDNMASLNTLLAAGFSISGSIVKHHYHEQRKMYIDDVILFKELS